MCGDCMKLRRRRDSRTRKIQTLFGTIAVDAPRISVCPCRNNWGFVDVSQSPLAELLLDRCTPELRQLQGELSVRHSYREAARLLNTFLPCDPVSHATVRNRTHRVAADLEQKAIALPNSEPESDPAAELLVLIDGADIRAAHGYQSRHLDVTFGKIEVTGKPPRRFALAPKGAPSPLATLRQALHEQGWRPGRAITVLSDGEAALPGLVRAAVGEPVTCILDWWHISMRVQHIQQALRGIDALDPQHRAGLEMVEWRIGRLRHLIWNGYHEEAHDELFGVRHTASEVAYLNGERFRPAVARLLWNCDDLRRYLANNTGSLIDYGARYRSKLPISTSRAEGCVDEIANARMAKKQRMRWSPQGAHRIAIVRAAVLDGRLKSEVSGLLAA
ncbi:ISKra4 family transposase [Acidisoma cladoniae]|uniref:ISKra4 family transposase n=1 Tax=Acidisoma cladoniae TaxID=3040935 RepID=UPI00254EC57C|nr:ISKra4 family transposase [Acidisoma sp. PAMC 29798]